MGVIRAILFDKDGTLTDFRATWEGWMAVTVSALSQESGMSAGVVGGAFGYDVVRRRILSDGLFVTAPGDVTAAAVARAIGWEARRVADWLAVRSRGVRQVAVPGAASMLGRLAASRLPLGVLTNATLVEAERSLSELGLRHMIGRVIGCDSGFGAKPDPRGAADFADRLGLTRSEVLLVGDGLADLEAARGAGLRAVAVLTGTQAAEALDGAEAVLPDVSHLPVWLEAQGVNLASV